MKERATPKRLTDLELQIMQVVWQANEEALTVRAVVERLEDAGRPLAYTTVQTMMGILAKKGALEVGPGPGRAHVYRPRWSRDEATTSMTEDFVTRLFGGEARPLVAHLVEKERLGRDELQELKALIERELGEEEDGKGGPR